MATTAADLDYLRSVLPVGGTALVLPTRRNKQGTATWLHVIAVENGRPRVITCAVAELLGHRWNAHGELYLPGSGVNPSTKILADLGRTLYGDDQALSRP